MSVADVMNGVTSTLPPVTPLLPVPNVPKLPPTFAPVAPKSLNEKSTIAPGADRSELVAPTVVTFWLRTAPPALLTIRLRLNRLGEPAGTELLYWAVNCIP